MSKQNRNDNRKGNAKPESKNYRKRDSRTLETQDKVNGNHLSWYVASPQMLADVASLPFNYRVGDSMPVCDGAYRSPGVMSLHFTPTIGPSKDQSSAINVAANIIYANTRRLNSGGRNYDAVDQMQFFVAMDSIYMGIAWFKRLLGICNTFSMRNRYVPEGVVKGMGVFYDDALIGNQALIRARLNRVIAKAATLAVPAVLPWFERHSYMVSHVYADSDSPLAQFYVFTPDVLYQWTVDDRTGAGLLIPRKWTPFTGLNSWEYYMNVLEDMVESVYDDEDTGIMTGDILKAYGTNLYYLSEVTATDNISPVYDPEFMEQIHNATIVGGNAFIYGLDTNPKPYAITQIVHDDESGMGSYLTQDIRVIVSFVDPVTEDTRLLEDKARLLDITHDPSAEWVMRATRLMAQGFEYSETRSDIGNVQEYELEVYGTEVVTSVFVYTSDGESADYSGMSAMPTFLRGKEDTVWVHGDVQSVSFSKAPLQYVRLGDEILPLGRITNVTSVSKESLRQLHAVACLGEFNIDRMAITKV